MPSGSSSGSATVVRLANSNGERLLYAYIFRADSAVFDTTGHLIPLNVYNIDMSPILVIWPYFNIAPPPPTLTW